MTAVETKETSQAPAAPAVVFAQDQFIPMAHWGRDHWTTLAYMDHVMTDCAGFEVGLDPRMRSNRHNYRIMFPRAARRPARLGQTAAAQALAIAMKPEHTSRLSGGAVSTNHDDWSCIQDMAAAGLLTVDPSGVEPGEVLHWSDAGRALAAELRAHKAAGGNCSVFQPTPL